MDWVGEGEEGERPVAAAAKKCRKCCDMIGLYTSSLSQRRFRMRYGNMDSQNDTYGTEW